MQKPLIQERSVSSPRKRNFSFDLLKAIGILSIILAHTGLNDYWMIQQTRNFDVPLMVIVSGALFWLTSGKNNSSWVEYLRKRIFRLIVPVWCFFCFFFTIAGLFSTVRGINYPFSIKQVLYTFLLLNEGVQYVWIVRVFLLIAMIAPWLLLLQKKFKRNSTFIFAIIPVYLVYELLVKLRRLLPANGEVSGIQEFFWQRILLNLLIDQILFLLIPYACLFAVGIVLVQIRKSTLTKLMMATASLFIILAIAYAIDAHAFVLTQQYKYPPRLYYLAYGLCASIGLYLLSDRLCTRLSGMFEKPWVAKPLVFISKSTLWIYLWHIFFLYAWVETVGFLSGYQSIYEFLAIIALSIATTYLQKAFFSWLLANVSFKPGTAHFLKIAFLQ
ncbi:MAG: acyltransferase family protein [Cyanophyceae cyanobacterium]